MYRRYNHIGRTDNGYFLAKIIHIIFTYHPTLVAWTGGKCPLLPLHADVHARGCP